MAQKEAAIPSLSSLAAKSKAESFVLQSIHDGREANLSGIEDQSLRAEFVNTLLFRTAASAVPGKLVSIRGATITGEISVPSGSSPVPNNIVFNECIFENAVNLSAGRFEQSLIFIDSRFRKGLKLDLAQVKGDVFLLGGSVDETVDSPQITLSRAQIEGQLQVLGLGAKSIAAQALKVRNVVFVLDDSWVETILLPQIDTESLDLGHAGPGAESHVGTLNLEQGSIRSELWLQAWNIGFIDAKGLHVNGLTALDPNVTINQKLDLSDTHLGTLTWSVPSSPSATQKCEGSPKAKQSTAGWPCEILASGLSFDDLTITPQESHADLNHQFLERASSSESAFMAYEQILRSRGDLTQADAIYSGMREKRRSESWNTSVGFRQAVGSIIFIMLDKAQAIFLGYGRLPLPPLLWSIGVVTLGAFLFREEGRMERSTKEGIDGVSYSRFWYSLELFLPVVDLGVAKAWRPRKHGLRAYARIHQLAGWILIPVSLAALTGAIR